MSRHGFDDQDTRRGGEKQPPGAVLGWRLIVSRDRVARTIDLPVRGSVVIGRAPNAEVLLDDAGVSRKHATLHVDEHTALLEDLGSANGTTINGVRLTPHRSTLLRVGDTVAIEGWMLLLQPASAASGSRPVWQHGAFEERLSEALRDAAARRQPLTLVRLGRLGRVPFDRIVDQLGPVLGPDDVLGEYGPGELEIALVGRGADETGAVVARLRDHVFPLCPEVVVGAARTPVDGTTVEALVAQACGQLRSEPTSSAAPARPTELIFDAPAMVSLNQMIDRVAKSSISVMVLGETGSGKEVVAELIHRRSARSSGPFVRVNCAALSESLLESELFGYEKGAFTGATKEKLGLIEAAHGGTLFLDEIGDVPLVAQVKLLRVLEDRRVTRVGGLEPRAVDIRVITATHRDLESMSSEGLFREDLYFRLSAIVLNVPPLRERLSDVTALARRFVAAIAQRDGVPTPTLSASAIDALQRYTWPGNVRELRNVMERAVVLGGPQIETAHLPMDRMSRMPLPATSPPGRTPVTKNRGETARPTGNDDTARIALPGTRLQDEVRALERQRIVVALEQCAGNQSEAAKILGMSRRTFVSKLDQLGVPRPRKDVR